MVKNKIEKKHEENETFRKKFEEQKKWSVVEVQPHSRGSQIRKMFTSH